MSRGDFAWLLLAHGPLWAGPAVKDKAFSRYRLWVLLKAHCWLVVTEGRVQAHCRKISDRISSDMTMSSLVCSLFISPLDLCWMFSIRAIASRFLTRSAREGEGERVQTWKVFTVSAYKWIRFISIHWLQLFSPHTPFMPGARSLMVCCCFQYTAVYGPWHSRPVWWPCVADVPEAQEGDGAQWLEYPYVHCL